MTGYEDPQHNPVTIEVAYCVTWGNLLLPMSKQPCD